MKRMLPASVPLRSMQTVTWVIGFIKSGNFTIR